MYNPGTKKQSEPVNVKLCGRFVTYFSSSGGRMIEHFPPKVTDTVQGCFRVALLRKLTVI